MIELEDEPELEGNAEVAELYAQLLIHESLIVEVPSEEEKDLRTSLINYKAKQNAKLKEKGLPPDHFKLTTLTLPPTKDQTAGTAKVQFTLHKKKTFTILSVTQPSEF